MEYDWKKTECDTAFLRDMQAICHLKHNTKRYSWWEKFKIILSLGYDVVKWWTIPSDSIEHCLHGAKIFHKAVDGFGASHFGKWKSTNRYCNETCARLTGEPNKRVLR